jgi:hypothetical protein
VPMTTPPARLDSGHRLRSISLENIPVLKNEAVGRHAKVWSERAQPTAARERDRNATPRSPANWPARKLDWRRD